MIGNGSLRGPEVGEAMSYGIWVWDEYGNETLSLVDRLMKVLGTFETGTGGGQISVPGLNPGNGWFYPAAIDYDQRTGAPPITLGNGVLSWGTSAQNFRVVYGIY